MNEPSQLLELANQITASATRLQKQLQSLSAPQPTFDAGGPSRYPPDPLVFEARDALIDASYAMLALARGPTEHIKASLGIERFNPGVLRTLDHFKIAEAVPAQGSISFSELAAKLAVNQALLERFMKYAFTMRLFRLTADGQVAHTAYSQALPPLSGWIALISHEVFARSVSKFPESLAAWSDESAGTDSHRRQLPVTIAYGPDTKAWDLLETEIGMEKFSAGMDSYSGTFKDILVPALARGFDWAGLGKDGLVIDVGGGKGYLAIAMARSFPNLRFIIQDQPSNEGVATGLISSNDLQGRVHFQVQDFFKPQPGDIVPAAYFLKSILHDWPDEDCVRILRTLTPAMERHGTKLFLVDRALPDKPGEWSVHAEAVARGGDLNMFSLFGAKERSRREWETLVAQVHPRMRVKHCETPRGMEWALSTIELG